MEKNKKEELCAWDSRQSYSGDKRIMRWAGYIARNVKEQVRRGFWWIDLRETDHLKELRMHGSKILKYIFKKRDEFISGQGQAVSSCECSNEALGSVQ